MNILKVTIAGAIALLGGLYYGQFGLSLPGQSGPSAEEIEGFFWPNQKQLQAFDLIDQFEQPFGLDRINDQWSMMFFGYTYCPDICPITLSSMREVKSILDSVDKNSLPETQFVFISVDGERDTPERLAEYIGYYNEEFVAASGDKSQVDSLAKQIGIPYEIEEHKEGETDYLVAHSGSLFLTSPTGTLAAIFHPPYDTRKIAERIQQVQQFMLRNG